MLLFAVTCDGFVLFTFSGNKFAWRLACCCHFRTSRFWYVCNATKLCIHCVLRPGLSTSRTIGDLYMKRPKNLVPSTPDLRVCTVDFYRDTFVVLGSDGIWDVITDQEACNLVSEYAGPNCSQKVGGMLTPTLTFGTLCVLGC